MKTMGNNRNQITHMTDILFTLALFCVFAASALLVVVIGARVYENTTSNMDANFNMRTSISYVTTKIRQSDVEGAVYLGSIGEQTALVLEQTIEEEVYQTWIYHYDGTLRELFTMEGNSFTVHDGQIIMAVEDFQMEEAGNGLLRLTAVDEKGSRAQMLIGPRCS